MTNLTNRQADYPRHTPLHELIARQAVLSADKIALIAANQELTYRQVNETANQLSHYLVQQGVRPGDIVGVALDRSPELLLVLLAIMKTGAAYLPIDPTYPPSRIQFMLSDSAAPVLVTTSAYQGRADSQTTELLIENALLASASLSKHNLPRSASGDDLVYVLYTSGSTGQPKGVLVEHHNVVNLLWSMIDWPGITEEDRLLAITTVSFDIAALELFLPLLVGATLVLADTATIRDGAALLQTLQEERITMMQATPVTYKLMLTAGWLQPLPVKLLCCGEPLATDLARQLTARCDTLWNMYGPTETTIYSTGKQILSTDDLITIGRPIHNTQVYITDEDHKPVPEGSSGEICIAGDGVTRGYLNRPELTEEKFIKNPFATAGLLYCTGDLGRMTSTGEIEYLGRIDQQIKIRGYRVEPGEIEYALTIQNGIREAVVVAHEDRSGTPRLVAYLVLSSPLTDTSFAAEVAVWKTNLKNRLPTYMVPVQFIELDKLPVTLNGKVDRQALTGRPDLVQNKTIQAASWCADRQKQGRQPGLSEWTWQRVASFINRLAGKKDT